MSRRLQWALSSWATIAAHRQHRNIQWDSEMLQGSQAVGRLLSVRSL